MADYRETTAGEASRRERDQKLSKELDEKFHSRFDPDLAYQVEMLLLWTMGCMAGLPDNALAGVGISASDAARLRSQFFLDINQMEALRLMGKQLKRSTVAEMLRAKVGGMTLTAITPAEFAAVARAVKSLPDWIWDDAVVDADGTGKDKAKDAGQAARGTLPNTSQAAAKPAPQAAKQAAGGPAAKTAEAAADEMLRSVAEGFRTNGLTDPHPAAGKPVLNRHQRRAQEARARR